MIEKAQKALVEFMTQSEKTQTQLSKEIGCSTAALSQFLKGIYKGDNEKLARDILNYLRIATERLQNESITQYYPDTQNTQSVLLAANYAHQYSKIAIIYGDAGAGKTEALKRYTQDNTSVIMVTANASCKTARAVLYKIANAIGLNAAGTEATVMEMLIDRFINTNKLLIIDEADHLTLNALQAVRNLNDVAGIGIVLAGNDMVLYQMYIRSNSQVTRFQQLRTRIGIKIKVKNQNFTRQDLIKIFPDLGTSCIKPLLEITKNESLRVAINVTEFAKLMAAEQGEELSERHINAAYKEVFELC